MVDDELMRILIFKQFSNMSILVKDDVINYLFKVLPREFPKILSVIKVINQKALEKKKRITVPFIKHIFESVLL